MLLLLVFALALGGVRASRLPLSQAVHDVGQHGRLADPPRHLQRRLRGARRAAAPQPRPLRPVLRLRLLLHQPPRLAAVRRLPPRRGRRLLQQRRGDDVGHRGDPAGGVVRQPRPPRRGGRHGAAHGVGRPRAEVGRRRGGVVGGPVRRRRQLRHRRQPGAVRRGEHARLAVVRPPHGRAALRPNASAADWAASRLYLTVAADGLSAYVDATPPQRYYRLGFGRTAGAYAAYANGSLAVLAPRARGEADEQLASIRLPAAASGTVQYMRLEHDGHLRLYEWRAGGGWAPVFDVLRLYPDVGCAFPTVCGAYGVCTDDLQCSCPDAANFRPVDFRRPNRGCVPVAAPVSDCARRRMHRRRRLVSLRNVVYFNDRGTSMRAIDRVSEDACKKACLDDCRCVAAQFVYGADARDGSCALQSEVFSLETAQPELMHYNSTVHLKVQAK